MSVKINIPQLRFSEFSKEWEEKKLRDLIKTLDAGVSVNSVDRMARIDEKSILKTSCVSYGAFDIKKNKVVLDDVEINRLKEPVTANSIIISRMNTPALVGANAFVRYDNLNTFLPDRLWAAKIKQNASPLWVSMLMSSPKIRALLSTRATGTSNSMKNITKGDVLTLPIVAPLKQEQEQIASFLSSVDTKIEKLTSKVKLLQEYKKGVMQKIFSQEIRFHPKGISSQAQGKDDDGSEYPEWVEKKLNDIAIFTKGKGISKNDIVENGKLECIRYGELYTKYNEIIKDTTSKTNLNRDDLVLSKYNDIIIPSSGETSIDIATASCVLKDDIALGGDLNIIRTEANGIFLAYYLNNAKKYDIAKLAQGSSVVHLYAVHLKTLKINLPSIEEQTKIANFRSSIDSKIEQTKKQLDSTKEFKKALLQQMFV